MPEASPIFHKMGKGVRPAKTAFSRNSGIISAVKYDYSRSFPDFKNNSSRFWLYFRVLFSNSSGNCTLALRILLSRTFGRVRKTFCASGPASAPAFSLPAACSPSRRRPLKTRARLPLFSSLHWQPAPLPPPCGTIRRRERQRPLTGYFEKYAAVDAYG